MDEKNGITYLEREDILIHNIIANEEVIIPERVNQLQGFVYG